MVNVLINDLPLEIKKWGILSGKKPGTAQNHHNQVRLMVNLGVNPLDWGSVENFLQKQRTKNSTSHYNSFVNALRICAHYFDEMGIDRPPLLHKIKFIKDCYRPRSTMSDEEIEAFLNLPPPKVTYTSKYGKVFSHCIHENKHRMWSMYYSILAYTGMRTGEVAKLTVNDIDWGREVIVVKDTKTNDNRFVPIPPILEKRLGAYVQNCEGEFLFPSKRPQGHVSSVEWHYNFQVRIKRLGIKRTNLVPYSLRHSAATRWLEEDISIAKVQKILGHKRIEQTLQYTHLTTKDIIETIKQDRLVQKFADPDELIALFIKNVEKLNISSALKRATPKQIFDFIEKLLDAAGIMRLKNITVEKTRNDKELIIRLKVKNKI